MSKKPGAPKFILAISQSYDMAGKRLALLIGNSAYDDPEFPALVKPEQDIRDLAKLLRDPQIGGFDDMQELVNRPWHKIKPALERFFKRRAKDDLLLLYFSGHDRREGDLYLICANSEHDALDATAVDAVFLRRQIDLSASQRKVIILDCCHSGALGRGKAAGSSADLQAALQGEDEGYGRIILTAARATETAREQTPDEHLPHSLFTHFLLEGIRTGEADRDNDGSIGAEELFDYAAAQLRGIGAPQTPQKPESMSYDRALQYVAQLNQQRFAGYNDWRLPTMPELLSLREPEEQLNDSYIRLYINCHVQ